VLMLVACSEGRRLTEDASRLFPGEAGPVFASDDARPRDMDAASAPPPFSRAPRGCADGCDGGVCRRRCIPERDPCRGVQCPPGHTCVDGQCNAVCFSNRCADVVCPRGQFCESSTGECYPLPLCDDPCPEGRLCVQFCAQPDPCEDVHCEPGMRCEDGVCVPDFCRDVRCPFERYCQPETGLCFAVACEDGAARCPPGTERTDAGDCRCYPRCPSSAPCGSSDGCGRLCLNNCDDPDGGDAGDASDVTSDVSEDHVEREDAMGEPSSSLDVIDVTSSLLDASALDGGEEPADVRVIEDARVAQDSGTRLPDVRTTPSDAGRPSCTPQCRAEGACGAPDGCGGYCFGRCSAGLVCRRDGAFPVCVCDSTCRADAWCGEVNGCGIRCAGRCPEGFRCNRDHFCECDAYCPPDAWCGQPDGCGGRCRGWCPYGLACGSDARCSVCVPRCPPGSACGSSDGCGGRCPGSCPAGSTCGPDRRCFVRGTYCDRPEDCPNHWRCVRGECVAPCPPGRPYCAGVCCASSETCVRGVCTLTPS
jgi:hypothetical protein